MIFIIQNRSGEGWQEIVIREGWRGDGWRRGLFVARMLRNAGESFRIKRAHVEYFYD